MTRIDDADLRLFRIFGIADPCTIRQTRRVPGHGLFLCERLSAASDSQMILSQRDRAKGNAVHLSFNSVHFSSPHFGRSLCCKALSGSLPRLGDPM